MADVARRGGPSSMDGITGFLGLRWEDPETVRLQIRPDLINRGGLLSGVATYAMVDYCMGSALWDQTSEAEHIATINIAVNYVQTATEGEVICRARVDRRNRTHRGPGSRGATRGRPAARNRDRQLLDLPGAYTPSPHAARQIAPERARGFDIIHSDEAPSHEARPRRDRPGGGRRGGPRAGARADRGLPPRARCRDVGGRAAAEPTGGAARPSWSRASTTCPATPSA